MLTENNSHMRIRLLLFLFSLIAAYTCSSLSLVGDSEIPRAALNSPLPRFNSDHSVPSMLSFKINTDEEKLANFKKISSDMAFFEGEYRTCIEKIEDKDYTQERIEECLGHNFIKLVLDIKYETLKIISKADEKVRAIFMDDCYVPAGVKQEFTTGCDLMEKDTLDVMWRGMDFLKLINENRDKYMREYALIPHQNFETIILNLKDLAKEYFEMLNEIDSHKEVTILRLKTMIDQRSLAVVENAKESPPNVLPPEAYHNIVITSEETDPNAVDLSNLPAPQIRNGDPKNKYAASRDQVNSADQHSRKLINLTVPNSHGRALMKEDLYANNHLRMFNDGKGYSGLNQGSDDRQTAKKEDAGLGQNRMMPGMFMNVRVSH